MGAEIDHWRACDKMLTHAAHSGLPPKENDFVNEPQPRPGGSDDVPVAVEYLLQLALRWLLWTASFGFGVGALVCLIERWPAYVAIPLLALFLFTAIAGWAVKSSRAKMRFDA